MHRLSRWKIVRLAAVTILLPFSALAQEAPAPSFPDVPPDHLAFSAIEHLRQKGILQGYTDGTFRPDAIVNRAEAVKIIVGSVVSAETVSAFKVVPVYSDIPADAWFAGFVEYARQQLGIIDGPPAKTVFLPTDPVKKAEFVKMILKAKKIDASSDFGDLRGALTSDAPTDAWFFPSMRYAVASSMTQANTEGLLHPARMLTRAEIAMLLFRLDMYREGRRTQALLKEAEDENGNVLRLLEAKDPSNAILASNRALLAARGALAAKPEEGIVKGAVKVTEGFQKLVTAYAAGVKGDLSRVLQDTSDAWHLAEKAKSFDASLATLVSQMQAIAKGMADEARALQSAQ